MASILNSEVHPPMENPDMYGGDIAGEDLHGDKSAIIDKNRLWPDGIVPYVEDPGLQETICFSLGEPWTTSRGTLVSGLFPERMRKITSDCILDKGRVGGPQIVSLGNGCGWEGTIVHELVHAIGFYHEQNRSDRDDYLTIYWDNIKKGEEPQFFKLSPEQNHLLTPFDYDSIMLYGSLTFSKDKANRLRTMEGKDNRYLKDVNSKNKLSKDDIKRINMLYNCK
ncbi:UNVERIFIED_CONTAM: Astacin-like metalloprotease toxin 1 [Trichonephila clavipes]